MQNLSLLSSTEYALSELHESHVIAATTTDIDEDVLFVVSEDISGEDINIQVWSTDKHDQLKPVASFISRLVDAASPTAQIVSFAIIPDTHTFCLITRSGDIAILSLDEETIPLEPQSMDVIGTITPGNVLAASFSPDSSLLAIVTSASDPTLILMETSSFDVVSSSPLHSSDYGEDAPVNVGWGSKATQFHGSLGKGAAQVKTVPEYGTTTPDDDGMPRISWRGDAQFFAVSALQGRKRILRVYSRLATLQSTAEDVAGLEHVLAWRPNGGLIASTQRFGKVPPPSVRHVESGTSWALGKGRDGRHDVVFFERNGLRHGEFTLREGETAVFEQGQTRENDTEDINAGSREVIRSWGYRIRELEWNADSTILSLWVERESGDVVQLWMTGNYHWYLKLEIPFPGDVANNSRLTSVAWHAEDPGRLILSTCRQVIVMQYMTYTSMSVLNRPNDTGLVAVVDGADILLTPFRIQNVPPPMASYRLSHSVQPSVLPSNIPITTVTHPPPLHIAFGCQSTSSPDVLAMLFSGGDVAVWNVRTVLQQGPRTAKRDVLVPAIVWRGIVGDPKRMARQVHVSSVKDNHYLVGILREGTNISNTNDVLSVESVFQNNSETDSHYNLSQKWDVILPGRNGRLVERFGGVANMVWQDQDGRLWEVRLFSEHHELRLMTRFPEFCSLAALTAIPHSPLDLLFVGLASSKLYATSAASETVLPNITTQGNRPRHDAVVFPALTLSQTCTSYAFAGSYLVWTATAPTHEALFVGLKKLQTAIPSTLHESDLERRRVERGARIVVAVPSTMSLVLQMPRGNLETVMPRPLVMEQVRTDIQGGDYLAAFLACRKHRVDLNVIVEIDHAAFTNNIATFVEQIDDVDHFNLFLSGLGRSSLPKAIIYDLCDDIRKELERRDIKKYVNSILTAHVVKTPPDYEAGLSLLLRFRGTDADLVEDAVKYIIFLVDADRLFDTALGMYDFSLVLLVAQYSQKDPREYLPFLRSLRSHEGPYQHFKIDDHLKRYSKAISSLYLAGPEHFEEAKQYVDNHRLYTEALELWKNERDQYYAMLELYGDYLFERREFGPAALAFVQSSRVKKAMVAFEKALLWQELFELVAEQGIIHEELSVIGRRVANDLSSKQRHVEAARVLLDYVHDVDEAVALLVKGNAWSEARRIARLRKRDDLVTLLILPGILEARSSIGDEVAEIQDLLDKQVSRLDELAAKKTSEPEAFYGLEDVSLANVDVMTDASNPDTMFTRYTVAPTSSDRSRRTSRSKRKLDRKAGRKGTVEEEEYLLKSLTKLVARLEVVQAESRALLPHLLTLSDDDYEARDLQREVESLEHAIRTSVERIWSDRETVSHTHDKVENPSSGSNSVKLTEKVPKPTTQDVPWKVGWIDLKTK